MVSTNQDLTIRAVAELDAIHDILLDAISRIPCNLGSMVDFDRMALHSTQLELAGSIVVLFQPGNFGGITAVARAFLEAYVELENVIRDPDYVLCRYAQAWTEIFKNLDRATARANPYMPSVTERPDVLAARPQIEAEIAGYRARGIQPLHVRERFERIGMAAEYESVYAMHSSDCHADQMRLAKHHYRLDPDGSHALDVYRYHPETFLPDVLFTTDHLLKSAEGLHRSYDSPALADVLRMRARFDRFQSQS